MSNIGGKETLHEKVTAILNKPIEPFEDEYQHQFIKVFIEDKKRWAQQIIDIVQSEYFDGFNKIFINYQIEFVQKYRVPANYEDLKCMVNDKEKNHIVKEQMHSTIDKIKNMHLELAKIEFVKDRAFDYFKQRHMEYALMSCASDVRSNSLDNVAKKVMTALNAGIPKDSGHDYARDYKKRLREDSRNPIPILDGLDEYIGGGVAGGELFVVIAPTGGGKSMFLVRAAAEALKAGKKVVYYTLELSEELVGRRFDACLNNIPLKKVSSYEELIKDTAEKYKINLKIKGYPDGVANINTLRANLEWLKSNDDFEPDMIVVDYADNMKALSKGEVLRHELVDIYRSLRAMAIDFDVPCLTASQTSGDGYAKKEIEMGMTAEAKAKNNIADLVVGFGRDPNQVRENKASLKVLKNRNGSIGMIIPLEYDSRVVKIEVDSKFKEISKSKDAQRALVGAGPSPTYKQDTSNIDNILNQQKIETFES